MSRSETVEVEETPSHVTAVTRRRYGPRHWILAACDATLSVCALIAVTGLAGAFSETADQVNNATPYWMLLGCSAALVSHVVAPRLQARTIALALMVIAGTPLLLPEVAARATVAQAHGEGIRVVFLNAWLKNPRPEIAARWLLAQKADVVVLTEVTPGSVIRSTLSNAYPHVTTCMTGGSGHCSTIIMTRSAPIMKGGLATGNADNRKALSGVWAKVDAPGGPVTVLGLHLDHPMPLGTGRDEMTAVRRFMEGVDRRRTIVVGDLNRTPWSYALKGFDGMIAMPRVTRMLPSWPANGVVPAFLPIDHLYAGTSLGARAIHTGPEVGSDHLPLVADLVTSRDDRWTGASHK